MNDRRKCELIIGTFDAERFWRDPNLARLPSLPDSEMENVVMAMDELLFPFCEAQDMLITRYRMNDCHKAYLHAIGFEFRSNSTDLERPEGGSASRTANIFDLITSADRMGDMDPQWLDGARLSPFAVIPGADRAASRYGLEQDFPDVETVQTVNSKLYSTDLNRRLGLRSDSQTVYSHEELLASGLTLLRQGPFLIKDEFGVSGKGNLLIESEAILRRVTSYLGDQCSKGRLVRFIIEPFLHKELDFSCQFHIDPDGTYRPISVQKLANHNFAYQGSFTADDSLLHLLQEAEYFEVMKLAARELYQAGYYGDVCVDSMLLTDGRIVPIVEVNARRSMSLIKHHVDRYLEKHSASGSMTHVTVQFACDVTFDELLEKLDREGVLYKPDRGFGILPLSANTLLINKVVSESKGIRHKQVKGRLYYSLIEGGQDNERLSAKVKDVLSSLSFKIVG
ncbi:hypothetical protein DFQ01_1158 [Paenibacillus cellulosilyticus]|uniref:ATP-grasp domain-containing protein n=1 Tax=Paenibacillus cellulosilyticus TaxID=375489 RepID=A0A2V2YQ98_9BACL|nr:hypothetical protein [Paenibacillus cellulosilyticus]PWV99292.1 hypothetical protein DFQ01_1158 [Paenibacillus cellulosilyticus]QKS45057.1 hypothetical protein HUB94_12015 [Paenibacillus cellulosilyticus]